jgi:DNA-binding NtrC family response regulator
VKGKKSVSEILIIDDDKKITQVLTELAKGMGHNAMAANTVKDGLALALEKSIDLVLLDLEFPVGNGLQILPDLLRGSSHPEVIIITGTGDASGAELAFKYGAWGYIQKPFLFADVSLQITRALDYRREKDTLKSPVSLNRAGIIGDSAPIKLCLEEAARAAVTDAGVLITGETGTGKELFARVIHENSRRSTRSFVTVDCGALPETLVESTLFGHEKGAFTGAEKKQEGLVLQAEGGTLFLDEIGDLSLDNQKALLRVLQERRIRPLGGTREIQVDFRLVSATNRNLDEMVAEQKFREDLLFRIRTIEVKLPPLRDRGSDIQDITLSIAHRLGRRYDIGLKGISPEFIESLSTHSWPGNVRELINVMEFALASSGQDPVLYPKHLPPEFRSAQLDFNSARTTVAGESQDAVPNLDEAFQSWSEFQARVEKEYLKKLLEKAGSNRKEACRLSGISQSRLYALLEKHGLPRFRAQ